MKSTQPLSRSKPPSRTRRWLRILARIPLYLVGGIVVLLLLVLASLNVPAVRGFVATRVNSALETTFKGQIVLERIGILNPIGIGGLDVQVLDAAQKPVLFARGLSLRANWPSAVWNAVRGKPIHLELSPIGCDHIEVIVRDDGTGSPTLAQAFAPRNPSPPSNEPSTFSLSIPKLALQHVWAHGALSSLPLIDTELQDALVSLNLDPNTFALELQRVQLQARGLPPRANTTGRLAAKLRLPKDPKQLSAQARFEGLLGGGHLQLRAALDRQNVDAHVHATRIPAEFLRSQLPTLNVSGESELELKAQGAMERIALQLRAENPAAKLLLDGELGLLTTPKSAQNVRATLDVSGVNLAGLLGNPNADPNHSGPAGSSSMPKTELGLHAELTASHDETGSMQGTYDLRVPSGKYGAEITPPISARGRLHGTATEPLTIESKILVQEPGAPTELEIQFVLDEAQRLQAELTSTLNHPSRAKRWGVDTTGTISAKVDAKLATQTFNARLSSRLNGPRQAALRAERVELQGRASGSFSDPQIDLGVDVSKFATGDIRLRSVKAHAAGSLKELDVSANLVRESGQRVSLRSSVSLAEAITLRDTNLAINAKEGPIQVRVRNASFVGNRISVRNFELTGAGRASGNVMLEGPRVNAQLELQELDAKRLRAASELALPLEAGLFSGRVDVSGSVAALKGELQIQARRVDFGALRDGAAELSLNVKNQVASGHLSAAVGESRFVANIEQVDIPRSFASRQQLMNARGTIDAQGTIVLQTVLPLLQAAGVPVERARGKVELTLSANNPRGGESNPALKFAVATHGLHLVEQRPRLKRIESPSEARAVEPRSLTGIDLVVNGELDARNHKADVSATIRDRRGLLADIQAQTKGLDIFGNTVRAVDHVPMSVAVHIPERRIDQLPELIRPDAIQGVLRLDVDAQGSLAAPEIRAAVSVDRLRSRARGRAVNLKAELQSTTSGGELIIVGDTRRNGQVLSLNTKWTGSVIARAMSPTQPTARAELAESRNMLAQSAAPQARTVPPLDLDAELELKEFPLVTLAPLADRQIRGPLSGRVQLKDFGKAAKLDASFDASGLRVGNSRLPAFGVTAKADGKNLTARVQAKQTEGHLSADFETPMTWGAALAPAIEPKARARVEAKSFDLETVGPIVAQYVSALEGTLDADLAVDLTEAKPKLEGRAAVRRGVFQLPQVGQRFSNVAANVELGAGQVKLSHFEARGLSGRLTASAEAKLNGAELTAAKARLDITEREKLPITLEGVAFGEAFGHADFS
ncbi:MAG TPA: hypothetical protein VFQ61_07385, partial [Polyangiaceae bacterium]|nr:hypothetical protein [Polyangiaceae bacterium]